MDQLLKGNPVTPVILRHTHILCLVPRARVILAHNMGGGADSRNGASEKHCLGKTLSFRCCVAPAPDEGFTLSELGFRGRQPPPTPGPHCRIGCGGATWSERLQLASRSFPGGPNLLTSRCASGPRSRRNFGFLGLPAVKNQLGGLSQRIG